MFTALFGIFGSGSFDWDRSLDILGIVSLGFVVRNLLLRNFRLEVSLRTFRFGSFVCGRSLGVLRLGSFALELSLGAFRLDIFA